VIALYNNGGIDRPSRDPLIHPLHLSAGEQADLIAFLNTLTEAPHPTTIPVLPR
jgi:cytochrome c peroxidase